MAKPERIDLVFRDGAWKRPDCECAYHGWDGEPFREYISGSVVMRGKPPLADRVRLTGIEAPHIHLCPKHARGRSRTGV